MKSPWRHPTTTALPPLSIRGFGGMKHPLWIDDGILGAHRYGTSVADFPYPLFRAAGRRLRQTSGVR
ncbi:hypothetical protein GCM10028784_12680 [Myceligenerans cantabricum]